MAAVFALVFLFAFASSAVFIGGIGALSFGTVLAAGMFCVLAASVFIGALQMVKHMEDEPA